MTQTSCLSREQVADVPLFIFIYERGRAFDEALGKDGIRGISTREMNQGMSAHGEPRTPARIEATWNKDLVSSATHCHLSPIEEPRDRQRIVWRRSRLMNGPFLPRAEKTQ